MALECIIHLCRKFILTQKNMLVKEKWRILRIYIYFRDVEGAVPYGYVRTNENMRTTIISDSCLYDTSSVIVLAKRSTMPPSPTGEG